MPSKPAAERRSVDNYIATRNPFGLSKPPAFFLAEMYAYDAQLRIFPSVYEPYYRIMRKVTVDQPWTKFLADKPDTAIAIAHKLFPVMSVIPQTILGFSWARVLMELMERDQQQFSDAGAVTRHVEGAQARREQRIITDQIDEADQRAADFYGTYKLMDGQQVSMAHTVPEGAGRGRRPSARPRYVHRPQSAGAGAFFTGRSSVPVADGRRRIVGAHR